MSQNEPKLTPAQSRAIEALLSEPTREKAAEKAGISRATLTRWLTEPGFKCAYREARDMLLETTLSALQGAASTAVNTLADVMGDKEAQPSARVSAAKVVLDNLLRSREQLEFEQRLKALEASLSEGEK